MMRFVADQTTRGENRAGKALEYLIAASCILMSDLRLNVSTPLIDDEGVDLVFNRSDRPATLAVQVKGRSQTAEVVKGGKFLADVSLRTFVPRDDLYVLYVVYDKAQADYGPVWLVPSKELAKRGRKSRGGSSLRFQPSIRGELNQWVPYRFDKSALPGQILAVLDSLSAAGGTRPSSGVSAPPSSAAANELEQPG
jgi:hypothetical protein